MSTCLEVLTVAYRRSGVLPAGRQLTSPDITVGMEWLNSMFGQWVTGGFLGKLNQVMQDGGGAYEAKERDWVSHETADTITLPAQVLDQGAYRRPYDGCPIVLTNSQTGVTTRYIYDATKSDWIETGDFDINDYCPLTGTFDMSVKTIFAVYIADENGIQPSPALAKQFAIHKMALLGRFGQERRRDVGSYF